MSVRSLDLDFRQGVLDTLFGETFALLIGAACFVGAALLCYSATGDPGFAAFAVSHAVVGLTRSGIALRYRRLRELKSYSFDAATLARWQKVCITIGTLAALLVGLMAGYSIAFGHHTFAMLVSITIALASTTGTLARSFGSSIYVHLQVMALGVPACVAFAVVGTPHERMFAMLFGLFMISVGPMATSLRVVLHRAIMTARKVEDLADDMGDALETMPNGLLMFDNSGKLKVMNSHAAEAIGLAYPLGKQAIFASDLLSRLNAAFNLTPVTTARLKRAFLRTRSDMSSHSTKLHKEDGSIFQFRTQIGTDRNLVVRIDDVTQVETDRQSIIKMARTDALTGLTNRARFFQLADRMRAGLKPGDIQWVAVLNLNAFKHLNEVHGAAAGDAVLKRMSTRLTAAMAPDAVIARTGGDEFLVACVQHGTDPTFEADLRQRFGSVSSFTATVKDRAMEVTSSIGLANGRADDGEATPVELVSRADYARLSKRDTDTIALFEPSMLARLEKRRFLREALKEAVQTDAFYCHFQPIVSARRCKVVGFEALCRWTHPTLGPISPGEFIPIAEETGLVTEITRMQLRKACAFAARLPDKVGMSVNLSALDLRDDGILDALTEALERSKIDPQRLTVEVTETSLMELKPETLDLIANIRAFGVKVALDDFGTGFSSLSYLHAMPLDRLKVDRAFVTALDEGAGEKDRTLAVLTSVMGLARSLDMDIVLEGVETERQLDTVLDSVDADLIQGYLYSKPLSETRALAFARALGPVHPAKPAVDKRQNRRKSAAG
ncbi:MAG: EAL domain-containing protein [Pseudomonadota bacterium]